MRKDYISELWKEFNKNEVYKDASVRLTKYKEVMLEWANSFMLERCNVTQENYHPIFDSAPINNLHELFLMKAFVYDPKFWDVDFCRCIMVFNFEALKENFDEVITKALELQDTTLNRGRRR